MIFLYILSLILLIYMCTNIKFKDRIWIVLFTMIFLLPIINIAFFFIYTCNVAFGESGIAELKDTKLNRWLFESKFDK